MPTKQFRPENLVLRCYGQVLPDGRYYGACIDLDIAAEANTPKELKEKLHQMISSYLKTVLDTEDRDSIPALLSRKAPPSELLKYHFIRLVVFAKAVGSRFIFKESIPFHLSGDCHGREVSTA